MKGNYKTMLNKFLVITRDEREKYISEHLRYHNYKIDESSKLIIGFYDGIILPINHKISDEIIDNYSLILGGNIKEDELINFQGKTKKIVDYYQNETVKYKNAILTAQATLAMLFNYKKSLNDTKILIIGYGRIGKIISRYLYALGINPYVSARKEIDLAQIESLGYYKELTSDIKNIDSFDIIINTVPFLIVDKIFLNSVKKDVYIIDLASKPGGIDFEYAKAKELNCVQALGLPGKFYPESAGKILAESIIKILSERS